MATLTSKHRRRKWEGGGHRGHAPQLFLASVHVYYKWKNHFVEMKGDVGMSVHEKGGKQVNATPTHKIIYNPTPTSL